MKSLWNELDALNTFFACVCDCNCGAKAKTQKAHQDERLLQFLMGLNNAFIGVRSNILLTSPLPNIGQAYSLREIHATPVYPGDSASFNVATQSANFSKFKNNKEQKGMSQSKKGNEICAYCKKPGHTIEQCYRLHGFPTDFKFTNQKKFQGRGQVQANNVFNSEEARVQPTNNAENVQALTQECGRIVATSSTGEVGTAGSRHF
uniref:Uncharacterized protein LOC104229639 n=1 Tax=Nicotiana sylvestris TaxID=4096 RepID=A0A1U7WKW4_NICSY|nr:PREDICTED: uncharacterized protein LOC104229639 [Nicotiana sylvestris]